MAENDPTEREGVSKLSRRGLMAVGAALAGTGGLSALTDTASAQNAMYMRDAYVGPDSEKSGLGTKGWLYFASDTGMVYHHTGSQWEDIGIGSPWSDSDGDGLYEQDKDGIDVPTVKTQQASITQLGSRGILSTEQTINPDTWTNIQFDSTSYDDMNEWDETNYQWKADRSGRYLINYALLFKDTNGGQSADILVDLNGSSVAQSFDTTEGGYSTHKTSAIRELAAGDVLEFKVRQKESSSLTVAKHDARTYAEVTRLG